MSRLNAWLDSLGAFGVLGIGVLLFCVPFYFSALRPAEQALAAQRDAAERPPGRESLRAFTPDDRAGDLLRLYALLPPLGQLPDELARVYGLAKAQALELSQGEYRLEQPAAGPIAYRVTLPLRGSYVQVRAFLDAVLREMPLASVDALRFERERALDARLDAQIQLTLHFRPGDEAERQ